MTRWLSAWWPALAWAVVVFGLSSIPGGNLPDVPGPNLDKVVHVGLYVMLGALCWRGVSRTTTLAPARAVILASALAAAYGLTDEFHQRFTRDRSPDWQDAVADAAGGLMGGFGAALASAQLKRRGRRQRRGDDRG